MGRFYLKLMLYLYTVALLVCLGLQIVLKLQYIDVETGFYTQGSWMATAFGWTLAIFAVVAFVSNRLRRVDNDYPVSRRSWSAALLALLVGLSILAYVLLDEPRMVLEQNRGILATQIGGVVGITLGALAGATFIWLAFCTAARSQRAPIGVVLLLPSVWQIVLLVTRFNSYTTLTAIPDNLLTVLFMIFNSLFLLGHARTVRGFMRKDGRNYTIPAGLCASLTGLLLVVPNYVYMAVHKTLAIPAPMLGQIESIYILLISLYALVFVLGLVRSIKYV